MAREHSLLVPPTPPTIIDPPQDSWLRTLRPTFRGTSSSSRNTIDLFLNNVQRGNTRADFNGNWSLVLQEDLPEGQYTATAVATNLGGESSSPSAPITFNVDMTPPPAPVVTSPTPGQRVNTSTLMYSGTTEPWSTVTVQVNNTPNATVTADATGTWSVQVTVALVEGDYTLTATSTDRAGNSSGASPAVSFTLDDTPPAAPQVTSPVEGAWVRPSSPPFTGTSEVGSVVSVFEGEVLVGRATADAQGWWHFVPANPLAQGPHTLQVSAQDRAGNPSDSVVLQFMIDTIPPAAPTVISPANEAIVPTATPTIRGTAEAGSSVIVSVAGNAGCRGVTNTSQHWECTLGSNLIDGSHQLSAVAVDAAGNESMPSSPISFAVDTIPPAVPVVTSPSNGAVLRTATPIITGTAEAGTTVIVSVDGNVGCTGATNTSRNWECMLTPVLTEGSHRLSAIAQDAAGNPSASSPAISFTMDTVAPPRPSITTPRSGIFIKDATLLVAGTAEAGSTVQLELDGQPVRTLQVDASGVWSLTLDSLNAEGAHSIKATVTDPAGHSVSSDTVIFTLDQTPPETRLSDGSPWVQDTPRSARVEFFAEEERSTFECSLDGVSFSACSSPVTFENLEDGEHTFQVRARDRAGNVDPTPAESRWTHKPPVEAEEGGCSATGGAISVMMAWFTLALLVARRHGRSRLG
jgi:uncharacterized protein (TIGR03382 family)